MSIARVTLLTDTPEAKRERLSAVRRAAEAQIERKLEDYERARCYYDVKQGIVEELRAGAALQGDEVAPSLRAEQLEAIKDYVRTLPVLSRDRRELNREIARVEAQARSRLRTNVPEQNLEAQRENPTISPLPQIDSPRTQTQHGLPTSGIDILTPQPSMPSTQVVENADKSKERTTVMRARGEALVAFARYWMEKERQRSGFSHRVSETDRELIKADARADELISAYTASYKEKAPEAMLDREQNELINKSMWVIKDEDACRRISFEGRHAELVYEQETITHERERTVEHDTYDWGR